MNLQKFLKEADPLVVYSEGSSYRPFLGPILEEYASRGHQVAYVTSETRDLAATWDSTNVKNFYIGANLRRIWFFQTLRCRVILMTMPDLGTFHIKRSINPVHYVYTQHSLNSLQMVYREGAFDAYDTIFAAGPHHVREIRELERIRRQKSTEENIDANPKNIVRQGYVVLDDQMKASSRVPLVMKLESTQDPPDQITVLVAPSWGPDGLLEKYAKDTILPLLQSGIRVILRPHPRTFQLGGTQLWTFIDSVRDHPRFRLDRDPSAIASFIESDIMISAWSGAAFEYALAFNKPVSIDVPRKNFIPNYQQVPFTPVEISSRSKIGIVLDPRLLPELPLWVSRLFSERDSWKSKLESLSSEFVYNCGSSSLIAADALEQLMESQAKEREF